MTKITWNEKADAKLLAGILAISPNPIDFNALAAYMGDGVTVSAIRHRISRLRAKATELNDEGASSTPASPTAKRKRSTPKKSAKGAAAQSKGADTESGGEDPAPKDEGTDAKEAKNKKLKTKHKDTEDDPFLDSSLSKEKDTSDI
ncbi:hypothetical protein N7489_009976 [Penicillium chrysogenum]|uniref:Uncharacterized protein n=1 Tax=Penicillium chrysogenum TaxID=5076 RepID=A0ABQ8WUY3_PENCH|nr:uncharacterized protein N7489_009976 [Penicillium chrysogenum]KAJ5229268.1 hypothetical protein N7489_009976 [Penicillium chrysogenum]KAJ5258672.1 hypothetical protein N7524_010228 [Penicillium chrysogenum]KAJ5282852.1 hypothetical protein N7505_000832 [Penicillium chrysogenum]KAJ6169144.1 hypothetical protein N7497_001987 [Penicillium chrysogenum]